MITYNMNMKKSIISIFIKLKWIKYDLLIPEIFVAYSDFFFAPLLNCIKLILWLSMNKFETFTKFIPSLNSIKWRVSLLSKKNIFSSGNHFYCFLYFLLIVNCKLCQEFPFFIFLFLLSLSLFAFCASQHKNRLRQFTWMLFSLCVS